MDNIDKEKRVLRDDIKLQIINILIDKGLDSKAIVDFFNMSYDEKIDFYELYLADNENDLRQFTVLVNAAYKDSQDEYSTINEFELNPCKFKRCSFYDEYNDFCKYYCMDVSGMSFYNLITCNGGRDYYDGND